MFKVRLVKNKKKNYMPNLKKRLRAISGEKVFIGWDRSQGYHDRSNYPYETKNPITYPYLASILEYGNSYTGMKGFHFRDIMLATHPVKDNKELKKLFKTYLSDIHKTTPPLSVSEVLEKIGGEYVQRFQEVIGSKAHLRPLTPTTLSYKSRIGTPDPNSPLVGFGAFRSSASYRINGVLTTPTV